MKNNHHELFVRRLAGMSILIAAMLPCLIYVTLSLATIGRDMDHNASVQARAITKLVTYNPDAWMYATERLIESVAELRHPEYQVSLVDAAGLLLCKIGFVDSKLFIIERRAAFHNYGTEAGNVVVSRSVFPVAWRSMLLLMTGLLLGFSIWKWITRAIFIQQDLSHTQLEKSLSDLRDSEALFNTLADNTSSLIWMAGLDKRCYWFNKVGLDFTGRSLSQDNGCAERIHPDDSQHRLDTYVTSFDKRVEFTMEYRLQRHDGEYRWLVDHGVPRFNNQGVFIGYIGTCIDITDRKEAEVQFKLSQFAMEHASFEVYWLNRDAKICYVNRQACKTLGYSKEELENMSILDIAPLLSMEIWNAHWESLKADQSQFFEAQHRCKNGAVFPVEISANYVSFDGHEYNVAYSRDISERKKADAQIHMLAFYDVLTKLPNRRLLKDRLAQALAAGKRSECYGALMFLDMDHFKPLNDQYGHATGDLLLVEVARRLTACVREMDTVSRFGGDEFVVMLSELAADKDASFLQASHVAEKILSALSMPYLLTVQHSDGRDELITHLCTSSIGVSLFSGNQEDQDEIMICADEAMYQAKENGRNGIFFNI